MNRKRSLCTLSTFIITVAIIFLHHAAPAGATGLLDKYESGEREFVEDVFGSKRVYYHQRMIDDAIVERDYIVYQFDKDTDEFLAKLMHWRDDLPDHLSGDLVDRWTAEAMVEGAVLFSNLYIISPESDVYPLDPVPRNPCWVVRSESEGRMIVTIIDAVEGVLLGYGVPPPYTGFSLTGPQEFQPCSGAWTSWMNNAMSWFNTMGYPTEGIVWAREAKVRSHIKSGQTAMFYELAHGGSDLFQSGCLAGDIPVAITAAKIETWIADYTKMPFAFIGSCGGLCETGDDTFAYEFRKGEAESTAVVGYCDMAETWCSTCWSLSISWQNKLFTYMNQGYTVKDALDMANADYPACGTNGCMRFAGDEDWTVVPVIKRDPWPPEVTVQSPNGGEVLYHGTDYEIRWVAGDNVMVDSVTILLSTDGGSTFPDTIAAGEPNDSSFMWTVPDMDSKTARVRVVAIDAGLNEASDMSAGDFTLWGTISGVEGTNLAVAPEAVVLRISSANPVASASEILFGIPRSMNVRIGLYDVAGRHIRTLMDGERSEGYHVIQLTLTEASGTRLGPGIYFVRLDCPAGAATAKLIAAR
jgi:hypothetical protein